MKMLPAVALVVNGLVLAQAQPADNKPITPIEAIKKVNEHVFVQFPVKASKNALEHRGEIFLDSEEDFRDEKNLGVVVTKTGAAKFKQVGVDDPAVNFKDKTIQVKGTVIIKEDRPRIEVDDPKQIQVVLAPTAFGKTADGASVDMYTLANNNGMVAKVITYGAILVDLRVPDKNGKAESVVLGYDNLKGYEKGSFYGATVGRVANRIAGAKFTLDGKEYKLTGNLHGGKRGFNKVLWKGEPLPGQNAVRFSYLSADGEEGYPGNLSVTVTYTLTAHNELRIDYQATTDKPTPVNLTNHSYFNLGGPKSKSVLDHVLEVNCPTYTVFDKNLFPTGEIAPVAGTPLDFTKAKRIGDGIAEQKKLGGKTGYDHNYVVASKPGQLVQAAKLVEPVSSRVMTVRTDQPGIQVYTGNGNAICFETQHHPNSVNIPAFPTTVLRPGETYRTATVFGFGVKGPTEMRRLP